MSKDNNVNNGSGGISFFGLLQAAFIIMKVANIIDWSWPKVLIPTWIVLGIFVLIILVCVAVAWITWLRDR